MQHQDAVMHAQRTGIRAEEGILAVRAMTEMDLLKYAASLYKTQFVTTEKLARASVNKVTLDKVPLKVCEKLE